MNKALTKNEQLKKELESYKAFDSHYEEIEEDAKAIAEEHTKKIWLEEILKEKRKSSTVYTRTELDMYELGCEDGIIEVCEKILEEVDKMSYKKTNIHYVEKIIKDLGVEV